MSAISLESPVIATVRPRSTTHEPPLWLVLAAFAGVYIIWGSTFLGMAIAVESIPPLLMAGGRAVIAGGILYAAMRLRGAAKPQPQHWLNATGIGGLLLFAGNGGVTWAEQTVPSGITALIVAAVPLWMILIDWLRPRGHRPHLLIFVGLTLGFVGVALIILGKDHAGNHMVNPVAGLVLLGSTLFWAIGSVWSPYLSKPSDALLSVAMQLLAGGALLVIGGTFAGELRGFSIDQVTRPSAISFVYLTLIGSLVGFTAYVWLLQVSTPARVSTYAFVNPLIAVLLGRVARNEPLPSSVLVAGALIIASVVLITLRGGRTKAPSR
jgi:drug/metabolite transporter (DMT)-like permease